MDFNKSFVILEEAQECSLEQLKMISTRIGKRSTLYINGDIEQSNINIRGNAFQLFIDAVMAENERVENKKYDVINTNDYYSDWEEWEKLTIPIINFTDNDCQRSNICRKMLSILKNI
jgi:phosphate starvation-inducible PhoH-like protein